MVQTARKIALSSSRDIPYEKQVLRQSNARRIRTGVSVEKLAKDTQRVALHPLDQFSGIAPSVGSVRDSDDNALTETISDL